MVWGGRGGGGGAIGMRNRVVKLRQRRAGTTEQRRWRGGARCTAVLSSFLRDGSGREVSIMPLTRPRVTLLNMREDGGIRLTSSTATSSSATTAMAVACRATTPSGTDTRWRHPQIWPKLQDSNRVLDQRRWRRAGQWNGRATVRHERGGASVVAQWQQSKMGSYQGTM